MRVRWCLVLAAHLFSSPAFAQTDARFEALATLTQAKMTEFGIPGVALGVVHNGKVTWVRVVGRVAVRTQ